MDRSKETRYPVANIFRLNSYRNDSAFWMQAVTQNEITFEKVQKRALTRLAYLVGATKYPENKLNQILQY
jgi:hypothetical protein